MYNSRVKRPRAIIGVGFTKFSHAPLVLVCSPYGTVARRTVRMEVMEDEMTIEKKVKRKERKERRIKGREEVLYKEREEW